MRTVSWRICSSILYVALNVTNASAGTKEDCESWCRSHEGCDTCSTLRNCGPGYEAMEHFTRGGKNWHACRKNDSGRRCEEWCRSHGGCVICSTLAGCGPGYAHMEAFRGPGANWYACRARASEQGHASETNRTACEAWCREHTNCERCSTLRNCGAGYEAIEHFTGRGRNWHACTKKTYHDEASERNRNACDNWCNEHDDCLFCSRTVGCGVGYRSVLTFGGRGKNWYSCVLNDDGRACSGYCEETALCDRCLLHLNECRTYSLRNFGPWHACSRE
jgi:hypothetical protein